MFIDITQRFLEVVTPNKVLIRPKEKRRASLMQLVSRYERHAKRQVAQVSDVDAIGLSFVSNQLRRKRCLKEKVNRDYIGRIGCVDRQRWTPAFAPSLNHLLSQTVRQLKDLESQAHSFKKLALSRNDFRRKIFGVLQCSARF